MADDGMIMNAIGKGYGFAYARWMSFATGYRREAAQQGLTFFMLFNSLNGRLP